MWTESTGTACSLTTMKEEKTKGCGQQMRSSWNSSVFLFTSNALDNDAARLTHGLVPEMSWQLLAFDSGEGEVGKNCQVMETIKLA